VLQRFGPSLLSLSVHCKPIDCSMPRVVASQMPLTGTHRDSGRDRERERERDSSSRRSDRSDRDAERRRR